MLESCSLIYEIARFDMGLSLFFFLQNSLGVQVLDACCDEEQRKRFLPDLIGLRKYSCFCLTEPDGGSDATAGMKTTARKVDGGYVINGHKRWPGNAVIADYSIVWAKNLSDGNKIQGFVVEKGTAGHSAKPIPNKVLGRVLEKYDPLFT